MMLAGGAIAWNFRVQITISLSTTEAEILSASDAGCLAFYLRSGWAAHDGGNSGVGEAIDDGVGVGCHGEEV
jgi:hypothetical protein